MSKSEPDAPATLGQAAAGGFDKFRIIEGDELQPYLDALPPKETGEAAEPAPVDDAPAAPPAGGDAMETE